LREILNNNKLKVNPIGFIDDDNLKIGRKFQGYPILGTYRDLSSLIKKYGLHGVVISFSKNESNNFDGIRNFCKTNDLFLKQFSIQLEDVDLEIRILKE